MFSLTVFKKNVAMINGHNLEADLGLHSYTLKINQFADMVQTSIWLRWTICSIFPF
jgi:hypothetical protein